MFHLGGFLKLGDTPEAVSELNFNPLAPILGG
jgi:hypothetical protein